MLKNVGKAVYNYSLDAIKRHKFNGGRIIEEGMKEGVIDIVKDPNIIGNDLFDTITKLQTEIVNGKLIIPSTDHEFDLFKARL